MKELRIYITGKEAARDHIVNFIRTEIILERIVARVDKYGNQYILVDDLLPYKGKMPLPGLVINLPGILNPILINKNSLKPIIKDIRKAGIKIYDNVGLAYIYYKEKLKPILAKYIYIDKWDDGDDEEE